MNISELKRLLKKQSIVIVGFMGSGKSTLGRNISTQLSMPFVDTDKEIEKQENLSIKKIFESRGERYFRKREEEYILQLVQKNTESLLISLGGGGFINDNVRWAIKEKKIISLWLNVDIKLIFKRLQNSKGKRPLAQEFDTEEKLNSLLKKRSIFYKDADIELKVQEHKMHSILSLTYNTLYIYGPHVTGTP